jgi:vacuolar protein sorting-associated protein 41
MTMAEGSGDQDEGKDRAVDDSTSQESEAVEHDDTEDGDSDAEEEEDKEEDEEDDEPKLKYARLTGNLQSVYRNGDATSAFLVAGDKMARPQVSQGIRLY